MSDPRIPILLNATLTACMSPRRYTPEDLANWSPTSLRWRVQYLQDRLHYRGIALAVTVGLLLVDTVTLIALGMRLS